MSDDQNAENEISELDGVLSPSTEGEEEDLLDNLDPEMQAELDAFAREQAEKLGLSQKQWTEPVTPEFTRSQRDTTTILVSGLTLAHDTLVCAALRSIGYVVDLVDSPDNLSLQFGKEFGNRGQCNPTYFTVGNLVKFCVQKRDDEGMSTEDIINKYVFLTAGACGPCRFGTYVTEYRKALRDAGFEGFRVLLFQQQGGVKQATGEGVGLEINKDFAIAIVKALIAGDVLNLLAYRMRPYELEEGSTNEAVRECRDEILVNALEEGNSVLRALYKCRKRMEQVEIDRSVPKPVVSVIGEFWAMTTEGEGNYHLQRFLEQEGAEVDIQPVTAWILFMVWENRFDTKVRQDLREDDGSRKGLEGSNPTKKLWILAGAEQVVRGTFQTYAHAIGLYGYTLPDMDEIATLASAHHDNFVRGGEAHMEVGKLVHFVEDQLNHMTLSVKPFGCMPSSGVSDGVQAAVQGRFPEAIFLPIETTGDGAINVYSRVQMMLYKAKKKCEAELDDALAEGNMDQDQFQVRLAKSRYANPFKRAKHRVAGTAANLAYALS